jgi:DNA-binding transcriptional regulator YiaG
MMDKTKATRLRRAGWKIGSAQDFLGLNDEESALIEMKLALATTIRKRRETQELTQLEFAKQLGSSQSRVAKMEAADASVSLELLVQAMLKLGASRQEVGRVIGRKPAA